MSNCNWERDLRYTVMNEWKKKDPMMARWSAFDPQGREISFPAVSIKPHSHKNKNQNQKAKTNNKPKRKKKFFLKGHLSKYIGHCKGIVSKALSPQKKVHDAATAFVQTLELDCKKTVPRTRCGNPVWVAEPPMWQAAWFWQKRTLSGLLETSRSKEPRGLGREALGSPNRVVATTAWSAC